MSELESKISLSKFLSEAGIASRRKAVALIMQKYVRVNGTLVTEPGFKVSGTDKVMYADQPVRIQRKIYILCNKPADCITSADDERGRKTVFDILALPSDVRVFPVGRLDRDTTGLLVLTNDGDLAQKLSHPRYQVNKSYVAVLDRPFQHIDLVKLRTGIVLDDGFIKPDRVSVVAGSHGYKIIVELHSGKNRIVRRMFLRLGYYVQKLDRVAYAGLTKRGLCSGAWRLLTKQEVARLKNL